MIKYSCFLFSFCLFFSTLYTEPEQSDSHTYLKIGSGVSVSRTSHIDAPTSFWTDMREGYADQLGIRPILNGGIGYEFTPLFAADLLLSYRMAYTYKKHQTPVTILPTEPVRTRRFHLDIASLLGSFYLNGRGSCWFDWKVKCGSIYPLLGGGLGYSRILVYDFRYTDIPPEGDSPFPSFGSDNEHSVKYRFTYQLLGGLEYRHLNNWAISTGYRWFQVKKFSSSRYFRYPDGRAADAASNVMEIPFSAHEWYLELKIFL